jgi:hypothetical protein
MGLLAAICAAGQGERIIAGTIVERLTLTSSGAFELLTPGSTKAVPRSERTLEWRACCATASRSRDDPNMNRPPLQKVRYS